MATLADKMRLLRGLCGNGERALNGPFYATVDTTRRCNLKCVGCAFHSPAANARATGNSPTEDMPLPLFKSFCEEIEDMGTGEMILIGEGEPLLHPHIFDMIDFAKARGMSVTLLTNGTLLDEEKCRGIMETRLDILKVSLWGTTPEEYEKNYPGTPSNHLERVVDGLRTMSGLKAELRSTRPVVKLHQPVNRYNFLGLDRLIALARETGCDFLSLSPFKTRRGKMSSAALTPDEENSFIPTLAAARKRLDSISMGHNIDDTIIRYKMGENVCEKMPCYVGWLHSRVKVDGSVFPCNPCHAVMGNLNKDGFRDIWNGPAYRAFRTATITREGLARFNDTICDCGYCCHAGDNARVHGIFKWFAPVFNRERSSPL
jgi:MoaA/NifB/PqqE/SkfB family radical SAM enzyme